MSDKREILRAVINLLEQTLPKEAAKTGDVKIDAIWAQFVKRLHEAITEAREGLER